MNNSSASITPKERNPKTAYRMASLVGALVFATFGLVFLAIPEGLLGFFNTISRPLGMRPSPVQGMGFYLVPAVGYMYTVTVLAFMMYLHPRRRTFPALLAHGMMAGSFLSLYLFLIDGQYLIYVAACIGSGAAGLAALTMAISNSRMRQ